MFTLLKNKKISKEAIEDIMIALSDFPELSVKEVKEKLNIESVSEKDLDEDINKNVDDNEELIKKRQLGAVGPLMGPLMEKYRGKVDGKIISEKLRKSIQKKLKE